MTRIIFPDSFHFSNVPNIFQANSLFFYSNAYKMTNTQTMANVVDNKRLMSIVFRNSRLNRCKGELEFVVCVTLRLK